MNKGVFVLLLLFFASVQLQAQGYAWGVKGGVGLNTQQWNSFERDLLFTPCIDVFTETYAPYDPNRFFASLGFHTRGSSIRGFNFNNAVAYKFNNLVVELGGRRLATLEKEWNMYYALALRAEYTVFHNLDGNRGASLYDLVNPQFVNRFIYGATLSGGFETKIGDNLAFIELSINPDLANQYDQPFSYVSTLRDFNNNFVVVSSQRVRNISIELKVGYRFVNYYDEDEDDYGYD